MISVITATQYSQQLQQGQADSSKLAYRPKIALLTRLIGQVESVLTQHTGQRG